VNDRHAEDGHHRITNELLHGAAVARNDPPRELEVPLHHPAYRLRIESLAKLG
jgi:hypothetical protein